VKTTDTQTAVTNILHFDSATPITEMDSSKGRKAETDYCRRAGGTVTVQFGGFGGRAPVPLSHIDVPHPIFVGNLAVAFYMMQTTHI